MCKCLHNSKAVEGVSATSRANRSARVRSESDGYCKTQAYSESETASAGHDRLDTMKEAALMRLILFENQQRFNAL